MEPFRLVMTMTSMMTMITPVPPTKATRAQSHTQNDPFFAESSSCIETAHSITNRIASLTECMMRSSIANSSTVCTLCYHEYHYLLKDQYSLSKKITSSNTKCREYLDQLTGYPSVLTQQLRFASDLWHKFKCQDCIDPSTGTPNRQTLDNFDAIRMLTQCVHNCTGEITSRIAAAKSSRYHHHQQDPVETTKIDSIIFFASFARCNLLHHTLTESLGNPRRARNRCFDVKRHYMTVSKQWTQSSCYRNLGEQGFSFAAYLITAGVIMALILVVGFVWYQFRNRRMSKIRCFN